MSQDRRDPILVGHRVEAFQTQARVVVHRRAAATAGDHDVPGGHEVTDRVALHHGNRARAGREAAPSTWLLFHDGHAAGSETGDARGVEGVPDRLRGAGQIGVTGIA